HLADVEESGGPPRPQSDGPPLPRPLSPRRARDREGFSRARRGRGVPFAPVDPPPAVPFSPLPAPSENLVASENGSARGEGQAMIRETCWRGERGRGRAMRHQWGWAGAWPRTGPWFPKLYQPRPPTVSLAGASSLRHVPRRGVPAQRVDEFTRLSQIF